MHKQKHPATKTFQALRIAVNNELGELEAALEQLPALMRRPADTQTDREAHTHQHIRRKRTDTHANNADTDRGARAVFISFHSLEDRIVKNAMRAWTTEHRAVVVKPQLLHTSDSDVAVESKQQQQLQHKGRGRGPLSADESELAANPRARSAKLRAVERLAPL